MRNIFRSERHSSAILLIAALLGLILANSPCGAALMGLNQAEASVPLLGLDLSFGEWISDFLLAIFFFIVAIELKYELVSGELNGWRKALVPALGALGGVVVPALIYLLVTGGGDLAKGWPIPTATDIAFALGVLAVFGKGLPTRMRAFLLALAVLDDLIGITIIAVFFAGALDWVSLLGALVCLAGFWFVAARSPLGRHRMLTAVAMVVLAVATWYFVYESGVHPTIAGVLLGLVIPRRRGARLAEHLQPWSNGLILPIFAFTSALVVLPVGGMAALRPVFFGVALALPLGKLVGITMGGLVAALVTRGKGSGLVTGWDLIALAMTGGIGFTVALLMNQLAYAGLDLTRDQGVLGVLAGSGVSLVLGGALISWRAAHHRRLA
ncbi:MAG: Na+/H+ antiporter NhaA [Lacisediminihabitans sp.]